MDQLIGENIYRLRTTVVSSSAILMKHSNSEVWEEGDQGVRNILYITSLCKLFKLTGKISFLKNVESICVIQGSFLAGQMSGFV